MKLLDLFCGRWGWSEAFAYKGWDCLGVDLVKAGTNPLLCVWEKRDVLELDAEFCRGFDFICASPPCEEFAKYSIRCFYPNPPYPFTGIKLFNHTRAICEASGVPYVIENVNPAQKFVGYSAGHCGPFYLWGSGVPPLMPQGILKGRRLNTGGYKSQTGTTSDKEAAAKVATIPIELANCVAEYAEKLLEATWKQGSEVSG